MENSSPSARRGPFWAWLLVCVGLVVGVGYLRFVVFPGAIIPLASAVALLVCLWNRDLRLLWGMAAAFVLMAVHKAFFFQPLAELALEPRLAFVGMQVLNISVAGGVIHAVIGLTGRLEQAVASLEQGNSELEASNAELASREEEISRQNEELQAQGEELEQQMEELGAQTQELEGLNEQLAVREGELRDLLDTSFAGASEQDMLAHIGVAIRHLLGPRAAGAAMIALVEGQQELQPVYGLQEPAQDPEPRRSTLGALVWERHESAYLADVEQRPDLELPRLEDGAVRSVIAAPLRGGADEVGALEVYSSTKGAWTKHDLRLVQWLAEQCGRLWVNARLTSKLERERELKLERERAARLESERVSRAKDEFVATLSHELRTPLNAMLGWATIVQRPDCGEEALRRGLEVIERNGRLQAQLIADLLDISRIHAGKVNLEVAPVDIAALVEGAIESVRLSAEAKELRLEQRIAPLEGLVLGDSGRLQQVVWNFLTNAIKFTPRGGSITVEVRPAAGSCEVEVTDTGQGIDPDVLPLLFDRYFQGDGSATRRQGGLGLGLSIARKLAELHGGRIEAHSEGAGRGSRFLLRLPLRAPHAVAGQLGAGIEDEGSLDPPGEPSHADGAIAAAAQSIAGLSLLVVDDDGDAREFLQRLLAGRGAKLSIAASAAEALRLLEEQRPDVLVTDIGMPEMDGYALIRSVRTHLSLGELELPAIALTAFAGPDDRARALLAGFQCHLPKPVEPGELVAAISRLGGRRHRL